MQYLFLVKKKKKERKLMCKRLGKGLQRAWISHLIFPLFRIAADDYMIFLL